MQLNLDALSTPSIKSEAPGQIVINPNRLGDLAEKWVCMLAAWKGAEVYPNMNCTGKADLLMKFNGLIYELDVKCDSPKWNAEGYRAANTCKVKAPVWPVAVTPYGDFSDWTVRWIRGRSPVGLENFWSKGFLNTST